MMITQPSLLISTLWKDQHKKISYPKVVLLIHPNNSVVVHTVKTKVSVFLLLNLFLADVQLDTVVFNVKLHVSYFFFSSSKGKGSSNRSFLIKSKTFSSQPKKVVILIHVIMVESVLKSILIRLIVLVYLVLLDPCVVT